MMSKVDVAAVVWCGIRLTLPSLSIERFLFDAKLWFLDWDNLEGILYSRSV